MSIQILRIVAGVHRTEGGFTASNTVGLVVEYAPATGETRVRFPDGVGDPTMTRPFCGSRAVFCSFFAFFFRNACVLSS